MQTCLSPRTAMRVAYQLALQVLPAYADKFSRKDFTLPQLLACLVVREWLRLSYRKAEAHLRDCPDWLADIGLTKPPDHNTLCRAFGAICTLMNIRRMLDLQARLMRHHHRQRGKPLALDSTHFEPRHSSRHYQRRCRKMNLAVGARFGHKQGVSADAARAREHRRMPKLALAGAAASHLILAARARLGSGSDAPDFAPLLRDARRRIRLNIAVADSGFDSESNHRLARHELRVRSIIPARIGRPSDKPPAGRYRRLMRRRFARRADQELYGQRAQVETIHSMIKRNLGDELRSKLKHRRILEMLFRALVHNIMLISTLVGG